MARVRQVAFVVVLVLVLVVLFFFQESCNVVFVVFPCVILVDVSRGT